MDFDISDSQEERSSRLQTKDSPWAQWPSEKILAKLESAGIPVTEKWHENVYYYWLSTP